MVSGGISRRDRLGQREEPPSLDELLRGPIALGVLRSLMRDQERQMRENGAGVAVWALPVYKALQERQGRIWTEPPSRPLSDPVLPRWSQPIGLVSWMRRPGPDEANGRYVALHRPAGSSRNA
ncbi:hypothetical protein AHiyo1_01270 [Arthrobacter sp. Hiyo1]|nr:hypothetical protein AHiyo1_01270 [Arthrobacter sp. Hiyo1]